MRKQCFKCLAIKPIDDFYRHGGMADGRLGKCKDCTKRDVKAAYRAAIDDRHAYERARAKDPDRQTAMTAYARELRQRYPEKYKARTAVGNAIRGGRLVRGPCGTCGSLDRVEAHHEDYSKPLAVTWLCHWCHRKHEGRLAA